MAPSSTSQLPMSSRDVPRRNRPGGARPPRLDRSSCPPPKRPTTTTSVSARSHFDDRSNGQTEPVRQSRDDSDLLLSSNVFNFVDGKDWVTFNGDGNANLPVVPTSTDVPNLETAPNSHSTALTIVTSGNKHYSDIPHSPNELISPLNLGLEESLQRGNAELNRDDLESARGPEDCNRTTEMRHVESGDNVARSSEWGWIDQKSDVGAGQRQPPAQPLPSAPPAPASPPPPAGPQASDPAGRNATQRVTVSRRHGGVPRPPTARNADTAARPHSTRHSSANSSSNSLVSSSSNAQSSMQSNVSVSSGSATSRRGRSRSSNTDDAINGALAGGRRSRSLTPSVSVDSLSSISRSRGSTRSITPSAQQKSSRRRGRSSGRPRSSTPSGSSRRGRSSSRPREPVEGGRRVRSSSRGSGVSTSRTSRSGRPSSRIRAPSADSAAASRVANQHLRSFGTPRANAVITSRSSENLSNFGNEGSSPAIRQSSSFDTITAQLAGLNTGSGSAHEIENLSSRRPSATGSSRKEGGLMERLFGDVVSEEARHNYIPTNNRQNSAPSVASTSVASTSSPLFENIQPRTLLTASVYHNEATHLWIATINTNQKGLNATNKSNASKYLKAFSFHTEREARESAYANAPPKMVPFSESPNCAICNGKFAVFRRPCHCRNCGVCICSSCSKTWSSKMIPETYNMKNEKNVKVCKTCHFLSSKFRQTLLDGNYDEAVGLFHTGNVNLRCQFSSVKGESSYPIHCAAEGGNIQLLQWLVDVHFCPIKQTRNSNKGKRSRKTSNGLIQTSKGRTILDIAMTMQRVDILRYLVVDRGLSIYDIKDLKTSLGALEAVLNALPVPSDLDFPFSEHGYSGRGLSDEEERAIMTEAMGSDSLAMVPTPRDSGRSQFSLETRSEEHQSFGGDAPSADSNTVPDACILCYENTIDCVITPCGHQICCLKCSDNLSTCPVCNVQCQFIKIFRP